MNISFSTGFNSHLSNLNRSINSAKNDDITTKSKSKQRNTINSSSTLLEGKSKKNNILEGLMKQKENLINNKSEVMEKALKEGKDPKSIKEKLAEYDKQIKQIDEEISKLQLDDQRNALNTKGNGKKNNNNNNSKQISNNSSPNDVKTDPSMDGILDLSEGLSKHITLSHLRNKITGNIRELKSDIEYDEKFRGIDPIASKKLLDKVEKGLKNVDEELNNSLKNINNKIKNNLKDNISKNEKNENTSSSEAINTDKLLIKQLQATENIKCYSNILDDKIKDNGKKIDVVA